MKTKLQFILAFIAVVSVAFTGCEKKEDSTSIVGKWEGESYSTKHWINDVLQDPMPEDNGTMPAGHLIVEFKSDGTYMSTSDDAGVPEIETGKYTISGNKLTITEDGDVDSDVVDFSISNNKLSMIEKTETIDNQTKNRYEETTVFKRK